MKILHITPAYYPATYWGGPIFTVYHLNNALVKISNLELKVLATDAAGSRVFERLSDEEKLTPFPHKVIFTRRVAGACVSTGLLRKLPKYICWADVVHLTATFSFPTMPTLILCRLYGKPVVWSLRGALLDDLNRHNYDPQSCLKRSLKSIWLSICRRLITANRVILHVTSEQEKAATAKVYPDARLAVISNGVAVPACLPVRDRWLPEGKLRLMFMGRLTPAKGIENLLRAIAKIDKDISLDIYGTGTGSQGGRGYSRSLVALARELGIIDKQVRFRGHVRGKAKIRAFLDADACIVPSYSESFCIVVAEALAMGMPVIVSNRIAWAEVAKRGCGLVVGNDPDALANAIESMREMNLPAMGDLGWEWMRDEFGWDTIADSMYNLYKKMLGGATCDV